MSSIKFINYLDLSPSLAVTRRMDRTLALAALSSMNHKHGAILWAGGRLLSLGVNTYRNSIGLHIPHDAISNHAEINCLGGRITAQLTGTLYVARLTKGGAVGFSKPCLNCTKFIQFNTLIRKVIHT